MRRAALQAGSRCRKYAACGKIVKGTNFWFGLKAIARNVFGKELGYCCVTQRVYPVTGDDDMEGLYETEYLNSLSISGIPPHKLTLKVGSLIMMMKNLNSDLGLCNGTRLQVVELTSNCIRASIMAGARKGQQVFIPKIVLISNEGEYPFQLRRKQFPVVPAFSMTINKTQGQSIHHLGLYLPTPVFAHGQLYVALSRVTSRSSIKVVVLWPELEEHGGVYTKNVVYRQIFEN